MVAEGRDALAYPSGRHTRQEDDARHRFRSLTLLAALIATTLFAADASERKFIKAGMSEGEV